MPSDPLYNPSAVAQKNGHFAGLPYGQEDARLVLLPVPWDVTVSSGEGTASGPENILEASYQLDLSDLEIVQAWQVPLYFMPENEYWKDRNVEMRSLAKKVIDGLEAGENPAQNKKLQNATTEINATCRNLHQWVEDQCQELLKNGKTVAIIGGDHSTPLGLMKALAGRYLDFGILQIDAHMDLREAYEGFTYSHASIMKNALHIKNLVRLTQVGIRDFCEEEQALYLANRHRIQVFFDEQMAREEFEGKPFGDIAEQIIATLPRKVYISFDVDGLDPQLCPNTGTPVPGGLSYRKMTYLIRRLVATGREIIGFDLVETAGLPHNFDGNVAARICYFLSLMTAKSKGWLS